jgi:DNA processing protein
MKQSELLYNIGITMIPNIGPISARNLIAHCGNSEAVFHEKVDALAKIPGIGTITAEQIVSADVFKKAEAEINFIEKNQITALFYLDEKFPRRLKHYDSCPILIYFKGNSDLNPLRSVGIVGTRRPTELGKIVTEKITEGLLPYGPSIISGLAFGIDGIAHRKSLECGLNTVGILGHGLDKVYPPEHRDLARKMIEGNGGLITEFCHGTKPDKVNFPMRNRIIAALCDAVIIIESKESGGSIITCEFANDFNKDVFAVPGKPSDEYSRGCNAMIKQNKAHLIEDADDLAAIMRWEKKEKSNSIQTSLFIDLSYEEQNVVDIIRIHKQVALDSLNYLLKMTTSELAPLLLGLEFKGVIRSLPGKMYILV